MVAYKAHNLVVGGSNPSPATKTNKYITVMKKVIITLLLSLMMTNMFSSTFQTEYNYQLSIFDAILSYIPYNNSQSIEYKGIGYTTNYSNGQFNSTQYYQSTYIPSSSSSNGKPRPKKVVIRSGNDSIDTGRTDDYNSDWKYYHGIFFGGWYYDDGDKVWKWNGKDWDETSSIVELGSRSATAHPSVPIDDNYIWFMVCIVSIYSLVKWIKLKHLTN